MGPWSSGMILPLGGRGRGFDSRRAPSQFFIDELDKNSFEVLAYADDLCVLCDGRNQLNNVIKIIDKWSKNFFFFFFLKFLY